MLRWLGFDVEANPGRAANGVFELVSGGDELARRFGSDALDRFELVAAGLADGQHGAQTSVLDGAYSKRTFGRLLQRIDRHRSKAGLNLWFNDVTVSVLGSGLRRRQCLQQERGLCCQPLRFAHNVAWVCAGCVCAGWVCHLAVQVPNVRSAQRQGQGFDGGRISPSGWRGGVAPDQAVTKNTPGCRR